jgi:hypothetical protein
MPEDYSFGWLPGPIGLFLYLLDMWGNALLNWALPIVPWGKGIWHSVYYWGIPLLLYVTVRWLREWWREPGQRDLRDN